MRRQKGQIDEDTEKEIAAIIDRASTRDFRPLLYVIPYASVAASIVRVPVDKRAHPLSDEYIVEELRAGCFDVLELPL